MWTSSGQQLGLYDDGVGEIGVRDDGRRGAWREPFRRPTMWRGRLDEQIMPVHGWSPGLEVARSAGPAAGTMQRRSR